MPAAPMTGSVRAYRRRSPSAGEPLAVHTPHHLASALDHVGVRDQPALITACTKLALNIGSPANGVKRWTSAESP